MKKLFTLPSLLKIFVITAAIVTLIFYFGSWALNSYFDTIYKDNKQHQQVLGLPTDYQPLLDISPYSGPHPSTLARAPEVYDFPIKLGDVGPVQSLSSKTLQYPFYCNTHNSNPPLGQPLVDNHDGAGIAVFEETEKGKLTKTVKGYSKDCSIKTRAMYFFKHKRKEKFILFDDEKHTEDDMEWITLNGEAFPFMVRVEVGTINRFIYAVAALKGKNERIDQSPQNDRWNQRLIYHFRGGVGIGRLQGKANIYQILTEQQQQFKLGYGVIYSTGTITGNHYNILLGEDTANRVKQQFSSLYGEPLYTIGIGGSGGAIQQYLFAQNRKGLIDAGIALYSYPDMITQSIYVLDCELLQYYFDETAAKNYSWLDWKKRGSIEGMNVLSESHNKFSQLIALSRLSNFDWPRYAKGHSECTRSWRGLTPLVNNPLFTGKLSRFHPDVASQIEWTHWEDLREFYGVDEHGFTHRPWDNVGVQYGLAALKNNQITTKEFLHINYHIGSWKPSHEFRQEKLWRFVAKSPLSELSIWSHHNIQLAKKGKPAPRYEGHLPAMKAAYYSGQVFLGKLDIPMIDLRHYLDDELDMHHSFATFAARQRMIENQGHADNQIIWVTRKPHNPTDDAFEALDHWLLNIKNHPEKSVVENKPLYLKHACYDQQGKLIARGDDVWDGRWNQNKMDSTCMSVYPAYQNSRNVAGEDITGDTFKCHLIPVKQAILERFYGNVKMAPYLEQLEEIFPQGVCDYRLGDQARPADL